MTELREKVAEIIDEFCEGPDAQPYTAADRILALPEIADALKLKTVKPLNLGPSISTGTREADD